jgi:putative membrane protein
MLKNYFVLVAKGIGMGAANVIPGVSGGTIALITGIFQRLIDAIKSFNITALRLFLKREYKEFARYTDFTFLVAVFAGVAISILSLAKLLTWLFSHYPIFIWSYFFGLILASVYFVGRTVEKWSMPVIIAFLAGTSVAAAISLLSPATPNESFFYLIVCGAVAVCSMILPGISGSFVLLLMGNYELVINAVSEINFAILAPVAIGAVIGLITFSHFLSWVYRKFRDVTIATLTGFVFGSLIILWPWKKVIVRIDESGQEIVRGGKKLIEGYKMFIPDFSAEVAWAVVIMLVGILTIWIIEKIAGANK